MGLYGGATAKRQWAYSNSEFIRSLDKGALKKQARKSLKNNKNPIVTRKRDAAGKETWTGTKALKSTELLVLFRITNTPPLHLPDSA